MLHKSRDIFLEHISLGALGDSFYEYLLKSWIQSGKKDEEARYMYDNAMAAIVKHMITRSPGGLLYAPDLKNRRRESKMGHLTCFAGMVLVGQFFHDNYSFTEWKQDEWRILNFNHVSFERQQT